MEKCGLAGRLRMARRREEAQGGGAVYCASTAPLLFAEDEGKPVFTRTDHYYFGILRLG